MLFNFKTSFWLTALLICVNTNVNGQDDELTLEQILVENWNAAVESTQTCYLKARVYRKILDDDRVQVDAEEFLDQLRAAHQQNRTQDFLNHQRDTFFPPEIEVVEPYWNYEMEAWHRGNDSRVRFFDEKGRRIDEICFGTLGVAQWICDHNQIQVMNKSSRARYPFYDFIYIPKFSSPERIQIVERESVDKDFLKQFDLIWPNSGGTVFLQTTNKSHTLAVDSDSAMVLGAMLQRREKRRVKFLVGNREIESLGIQRPDVTCELHIDDEGRVTYLSIFDIEKCEVNAPMAAGELELKVSCGTPVLDCRNGMEAVLIFQPDEDMDSAFRYLSEELKNQLETKQNALQKSKKTMETEKTKSAPRSPLLDKSLSTEGRGQTTALLVASACLAALISSLSR